MHHDFNLLEAETRYLLYDFPCNSIIYLEDNNSKLANLLLNIKIKDKEYIYIKENINICLLLIIRSRFFQLYSSDSLSNSSFYYFLDFFWATFITYFKYLILFSVSLYYYYY